MLIKKGEVFVGDQFYWRGIRVTVLSMDYEGVTCGFFYSKKTGYKKQKFKYGSEILDKKV